MRQKLTYVLLWVLSAVGLSYAQELTITGVVKDSDGTPLPSASVVNRLVWQAPLWNILNRVVHSRFQYFIRQDDIVVLFIQVPNASKDLISLIGEGRHWALSGRT